MGRVAGGMGSEATDRLADLDASTLAYRAWSPAVIPGLLQTPSYAAGAIRSRTPHIDAAELSKRVTHRRRRCEAFFARRMALPTLNPCGAWFLIGETAIRRPLMNAFAHAEQLRHVLNMTENCPGVIVQVLMEDNPITGVEPFDLHHLDPGPVVGHIESLVGSWYTVVADDVDRLHGVFSEMMGFALPPRESRAYIREELNACGEISENTAEPLT
jgi:hypothetical protein